MDDNEVERISEQEFKDVREADEGTDVQEKSTVETTSAR